MDGYFPPQFPSDTKSISSAAARVVVVLGSVPESCHRHRAFVTIKMHTDFSFIQDIFLLILTARGTGDTFQSSAGYKRAWFNLLLYFVFYKTLNIKVFLLPSGRRGFTKHHQGQSLVSHE